MWMKEPRDITSRGGKLVSRSNRMWDRLNTGRKWLSEGNENQTGLCSGCSKEEDGVKEEKGRSLCRIYSNKIVFSLYIKRNRSFFSLLLIFSFRGPITMGIAFANIDDEKRLSFRLVLTRRLINSFRYR